MKKILYLLMLCGLLTGRVWAGVSTDQYTPPLISIQGAETPIPYGELVKLSVVQKENSPGNLVKIIYDWEVLTPEHQTKNFVPIEDGRTIFFGSGIKPIIFLVNVHVTYTFVDKDDKNVITNVETKTSGFIKTYVTIGEAPKPPDPGPGPDVKPDPKPPVDPLVSKLGLSRASADACKTMISSNKKIAAQKLSVGYIGVADLIDQDKFTNLADVYAKLRIETNAALNNAQADMNEWQVWDNSMRVAVQKLYTDKKLPTVKDFSGAFKEIAAGLKYVSEQK